MSDRLSPEQRHRCMSHIRSRNTKPELKVRRWLWNHGYRYRLCVKSVPGSPDIVMRKYRTAIFVNGCFWHGHGVKCTMYNEQCIIMDSPCCKIPNTNRDFWVNKIRSNQQRDQQNYKDLQDNGWQVLVVWECQLAPKKLEQTMLQVEILLNENLLATLHPKRLRYDQPDEAPLPVAAEPEAEYHHHIPV